MTTPARPLRVGWKVSVLDSAMASVRYRALMPAAMLEESGVESRLFATVLPRQLEDLDALVIVKSFTGGDLELSQRAAERGIPVLFDLCDNVFIEGYGKGTQARPLDVLQALTPWLAGMVVTTEPLAERVRAIFPALPVHVIPDGVETPELLQRCERLLRRSKEHEQSLRLAALVYKFRTAAAAVRSEGLPAVPRYVRSALSKSARLVRRQAKRLRSRVMPRGSDIVHASQELSAASSVHAHRIVWFGNHGAPHARFGMLDLLEMQPALEQAAREFDAELVVISNHREKFDRFIRPMAIPSRYEAWSPTTVDKWLKKASVAVVPNTLDEFSLCKSANRTVLALSRGVPVVATGTSALEPLAGYVYTGDPLEGLRRYLRDPAKGRAEAASAFQAAVTAFGDSVVRSQWLDLLSSRPDTARDAGAAAPAVVVVLHLIQDLDLALPVLQVLASREVPVEAWCSRTLVEKSPRVLGSLRQARIRVRVHAPDAPAETLPLAASTRAVLTVSETNLRPHRFSRLVSEAALARGIHVATMQHGLENVGLTYGDAQQPIPGVNFAAERIYLWGERSTLDPRVDESVRRRCVPVGCPKPALVPRAAAVEKLTSGRAVIGVFENLHWHRYDDAYRRAFLDAVNLLARTFPDTCFLVKPHHAGMWLTHRYGGEQPRADNLLIADPASPVWENHTAPSLLGWMRAVITTPSTVALDAARRNLPVAVFAGELELPRYEPLPLLRQPQDWLEFLESVRDGPRLQQLQARSREFVEGVVIAGDAAQRLADDLMAFAGVNIER